ncbi:uncharacterized protein EV154DRAFT_108843 [Mucor mucedo]|uniref:uncharacterized protein n=1 Tax=Mucor mucedo TaxID=29922 RepID=UPI00221F917E|nr:uncharacterized protein EV154DRAFT_108843 [Mucor mucedo]KAI7894186.1 hypothetical protein EV154DRAFT_108843 [Mucor mucedo]
MDSYRDCLADNNMQLLLQQKYHSLDTGSYHSNMSTDDTANSYKPTSIMQFNELTKSKRRQVKNACVNCQKACKKCDDGRPCQRCIKYNLTETCQDSIRKERKKGVKRGPYKRIHSQQSQDKTSKKMMKSRNVNRISSVTDNVGSSDGVYPQNSSVLPKHNKCNQTENSVTPPPPPPPIAICSSQNTISSRLAVSPPYHLNPSSSMACNNTNANIINDYSFTKIDNYGFNLMPSPTNQSLTMTSNSSSPQQHNLSGSLETNYLDMFSFYNNVIQHEQNDPSIYRTPSNSPATYSAGNSELVIDFPWTQPPLSKSIFQNSFHS